MSLLQKASIITTPTAYAEDYLYSIKPAIPFGEELLVNGNFAYDSDWTKGQGWSIANGIATLTTHTTSSSLNSTAMTVTSGHTYKIEVDVVSTSSGFRLYDTIGVVSYGLDVGKNIFYRTVSASSYTIIPLGLAGATGSIQNISVKEVTDADFDFDRNSTGTRVNKDYLIEDVPYNLSSYSEDFTTGWSNARTTETANQIISPDGLNNGTLLEQQSGQTNAGSIYKGINTSGTYTLSVFAKKQNKNFIVLYDANAARTYFNLNTGQIGTVASGNTASISSAGNGWYRCSTTFTVSSGAVIAFYVGDTDNSTTVTDSGGVYIWGAQLVKGNQKDYLKTTDRLDIPRIDYTNGEPSILLEPSRQNVVPYSTDFSNTAWAKSEVTVTANSITSPEGIINASLVTESSANALHWVGDAISVTSGTSYSISVYAKKKERSVFQWTLSTNFLSASHANYDLDKGVVSATGGAVTAQIIAMPNDWYRCVIIFTATSTNTGTPLLQLQNSPTASRGAAYQGDGSSGLYLYGAQVEAGSYATSLIHTSGSAVTRSADAATNAGNSDLINSTEGVLYAEIKALADDGTNRRLSLSDGSDTNRINLMYTATNNQIVINYRVAGTTQVSLNKVFEDVTEFHKVAFRWESGNFSYYADGEEISTDSNTTMISANTLNTLRLEDPTGANDMYANVKSVMVFKETLTDLELEKLTGYNNHELYMNYYNRLSYLGLAEEYNVESDINNYIL